MDFYGTNSEVVELMAWEGFGIYRENKKEYERGK